jgi:hypothetical protein
VAGVQQIEAAVGKDDGADVTLGPQQVNTLGELMTWPHPRAKVVSNNAASGGVA